MAKKHVDCNPPSKEEIRIATPDNWIWCRLIQVFNFIDYRGSTPQKTDSGIPLITAKNVRRGYLDYSKAEFISEEEYERRQTRGVSHRGDILFTTEAPMGNVAIADLDIYSAGQRVITFQKYPGTDWVDNKFYYYYMLSDAFRSELDSKKTGSTVEGIKAEKLMQFPVPIPPVQEQQRIVDRIESLFAKLDEAKEKAQAVVDGFEDRKAAILHKAFTGELTRESRERKGFPNGEWHAFKLSEIVSGFRYGTSEKSDYENKGIPVLRIPNIGDGEILFTDMKYLKHDGVDEQSLVHKDDVLIIRSNGSRDLVGKCAIVPELHEQYAYASFLIKIVPSTKVLAGYLVLFLNSSEARCQMFAKAKSSAGIHNINLKELGEIVLQLPPLWEQEDIISRVDQLLQKETLAKSVAEKTITQIESLKKSILAKAFRGELGTNDPTEPSVEIA